jgi:hypothetical protein
MRVGCEVGVGKLVEVYTTLTSIIETSQLQPLNRSHHVAEDDGEDVDFMYDVARPHVRSLTHN